MRRHYLVLAGILGLGVLNTACGQGVDPPARVGRVSDMRGTVSLYGVGATDWTPASLNYPLTSGDALWADSDARAEVHLGSSAVRIAPLTSLVFGEVSDTVTQVRLDEGSIDVNVRELSADEVYEIDTPTGAISLLDQGHYRVDVTPDGRRTTVTVRDGGAEISIGDRNYQVAAGTSATIIATDRPPITSAAIQPDDWERWADGRDQLEDALPSARYVSRDMVGYQDLDAYGTWQTDANYGPVWTPRDVPAGWAPYRNGHWESVQPWGWTWIDDAPWGFAPFHYGRWASVRGRWAWVPGSERQRPVYAPALVAFVGGQGWGASASFGSGGAVGWVPLAPGEPFVPAYRASPTYVNRVNINLQGVRVGVDLGHPDVNQIPLANRNVPGAMTAVPRDAFQRSRPVASAAVPVRPTDIAGARPSAAPVAAGQPIAAPPRGQMPDQGRGRGVAPHPPGLPAGQVTPAPPPQWRARPRPGTQQPGRGEPLTTQQQPPPQPGQPPRPSGPPAAQPTPAPTPPLPPQDRGRGQPPPRPSGPPAQQPTQVPPPVPTPPPAQPPPPAPLPPAPPPAQGRGRGRQSQPPPAPTPAQAAPVPAPPPPPPIQPRPVPPPPAQPAPPDQGRGRGRQSAPPAAQPTPAGRGNPPPSAAAVPDKTQLQRTMQLKQLNAKQQKEDADLAARHQAQLKQLPAGVSAAQLQQQQQNETKAQDVRHQQERDQLDKQFKNPN